MAMEVKARKLSNTAAGAIATLCKGNVINQVTVTIVGSPSPEPVAEWRQEYQQKHKAE